MSNVSEIIKDVSHRPCALPIGKWQYYQEWNNVLFLHWAFPPDLLKSFLPKDLPLDTFEGKAYISLVAFTMQKIRLRNLPSMRFISDFHEINLRTYVNQNNKEGVFFLNIEAEKLLSVFVSKTLSGLPYEKSDMQRSANWYSSRNEKRDFMLQCKFEVKEALESKTKLDTWLTERYCLYLNPTENVQRYDIHHPEWQIKNVDFRHLELNYKIGGINLGARQPDLVHYSEGVKVLAWKKTKTVK
jgi:uncharacterized protein YqjF (DUF2071 family)